MRARPLQLKTKRRARAQNRDVLAAGLREGLPAILDARAIVCHEDARQRVEACLDAATLASGWCVRKRRLA